MNPQRRDSRRRKTVAAFLLCMGLVGAFEIRADRRAIQDAQARIDVTAANAAFTTAYTLDDAVPRAEARAGDRTELEQFRETVREFEFAMLLAVACAAILFFYSPKAKD